MNIAIERIEQPTAEAFALIAALDEELGSQYEPAQRHGLAVEQVFRPGVHFVVAWLDGTAVGCGAVADEDGFAELKRMYVRPEARGRGVAQAIVARLEAEAVAQGHARLTLETGDVQHAAIRLYERAGFRRCAAFGAYAQMPAHTIQRSVFFEKWIGRGAG